MARDVFRPRTLRRRTRALLDKLSQPKLVVVMDATAPQLGVEVEGS